MSESIFQIVPHLEYICQLIRKIALEEDKLDAMVSNTCGLIGDIITTLVTEVDARYADKTENIAIGLFQYMNDETIKKMLTEGRTNKSNKVKQISVWALRELRKLKGKVEGHQGNAGFTQSSSMGAITSVQS